MCGILSEEHNNWMDTFKFIWMVTINRRLHLDLNQSKHAEANTSYRSLDATQWSNVYSMLKWKKINNYYHLQITNPILRIYIYIKSKKRSCQTCWLIDKLYDYISTACHHSSKSTNNLTKPPWWPTSCTCPEPHHSSWGRSEGRREAGTVDGRNPAPQVER